MKDRRILIFSLVVFVSFLSGGWLLQRGTSRAGQVYEKARLFEDILAHIAEHSVDSLPPAELYEMAIDGLIGQLDDPYASYLRADDFARLTERTTGDYGGLGMQIDVRDGWITVITPIADTPAEGAGIEAGDRIIAVDGESTFGWMNDKAVLELRGEPDTDVTITVRRPRVPEAIDFTLTRATIHVSAVRTAALLTPRIGYLSLAYSTINETAVEEVTEAVEGVRDDGARSLILDMRNTPGGILQEGIDLADLFLDENDVVVDTRGRTDMATRTYSTSRRERWPDMPIVVLVNGWTASAAEIIAGALQDHDRAAVMGTPTFGKGLVQTVFRVGPREALQLTTGRWYTPSGRTIQRPMRRVDGVLRIVGGSAEELVDRSDDTSFVQTAKREVYLTDSGRKLIGGGGIRPDITVRPDTLSEMEQAFFSTLGANIPDYRGVMTTYALELKGQNVVSSTDFAVTPEMRQEVLRRLRARDIEIPAEVAVGASELIEKQLGYEVVRYIFGRAEESKRRIRNDVQVNRAIELLEEVETTAELLAILAQASDSLSNGGR